RLLASSGIRKRWTSARYLFGERKLRPCTLVKNSRDSLPRHSAKFVNISCRPIRIFAALWLVMPSFAENFVAFLLLSCVGNGVAEETSLVHGTRWSVALWRS